MTLQTIQSGVIARLDNVVEELRRISAIDEQQYQSGQKLLDEADIEIMKLKEQLSDARSGRDENHKRITMLAEERDGLLEERSHDNEEIVALKARISVINDERDTLRSLTRPWRAPAMRCDRICCDTATPKIRSHRTTSSSSTTWPGISASRQTRSKG